MNYSTTSSTASMPVTMDSIRETVRKFRELVQASPEPEIDIVILTAAASAKLQSMVPPNPAGSPATMHGGFISFQGLAVEVHPTERDALKRTLDLRFEGKKVYLVT